VFSAPSVKGNIGFLESLHKLLGGFTINTPKLSYATGGYVDSPMFDP
jgi:hypothetical protein